MLIEEGVLGGLVYAQSDRLNVNYHKNDRSVMWDLAPYDVSMIAYATGKNPVKVISAISLFFRTKCDYGYYSYRY